MTRGRFHARFFVGLALLASVAAPPVALAQEDSPASILSITWEIIRFNTGLREPFDPLTDLAMELDVLLASITVRDPDFVPDQPGGDVDESVFIRRYSLWAPFNGYLSPEPPPIVEDVFPAFLPLDPGSTGQTTAGEGFAPTDGSDRVTVLLRFQIPEFTGENQAKLRGLINYDVRWLVPFEVKDDPSEDSPIDDAEAVFILAIENPALRPPNPPPFADAGPDLRAVAGTTVRLDGSLSFDSTNIGFDPQDPDVFAKDNITFTWEWISGPERVDPIYRDLANKPYLAEVTLNQIGTYVYRLTVDDNINALPSMDTMTLTVVSTIPENKAPRAVINGPTTAVVVGSVITLDGTASSDPNGDPLSFRWQQTDELGNVLSPEDAAKSFQPLSGLQSPIVSWQAIREGTFYFRLILSDGQVEDSRRFSVQVIAAGTAGETVERGNGQPAGTNATDDLANMPLIAPAGACGGSLLPLALVPLMLRGMRRRR